VTSSSRARTSKVKEAAQLGNIKIVNQQWLTDSMSKWEKQNEDDYLVSPLIKWQDNPLNCD
jgi:RNA polymerase II subunit A-like phosphatase